jgi:predicted DNA-binding transcriptional regulator AlpA
MNSATPLPDSHDANPLGWMQLDYWDQKQVSAYTRIERTWLWRLETKGEFPKRVQLTKRKVVWASRAIKQWMLKRAQAANAPSHEGDPDPRPRKLVSRTKREAAETTPPPGRT